MWGCRGWLANPDVPVFATSVFSFHGEQGEEEEQQKEHKDKQLVAAGGVARTSLVVSKPTVFRVAAEPALASEAQLKIRVFPSSGSSNSKELVSAPLPSTGAVAEATDNNLFTLLQPGAYLIAFEGKEPFLTTIGRFRVYMFCAPGFGRIWGLQCWPNALGLRIDG